MPHLSPQQSSTDYAHISIYKDPLTIQSIPPYTLTYVMCQYAVEYMGSLLLYVPTYYRDLFLCDLAVKDSCRALQAVPSALLDTELCRTAVEYNPFAIKYIPERYHTWGLCSYVIKRNYRLIEYIPRSNAYYIKLCYLAIKKDWKALKFIKHYNDSSEMLCWYQKGTTEYPRRRWAVRIIEQWYFLYHWRPKSKNVKQLLLQSCKD